MEDEIYLATIHIYIKKKSIIHKLKTVDNPYQR